MPTTSSIYAGAYVDAVPIGLSLAGAHRHDAFLLGAVGKMFGK